MFFTVGCVLPKARLDQTQVWTGLQPAVEMFHFLEKQTSKDHEIITLRKTIMRELRQGKLQL